MSGKKTRHIKDVVLNDKWRLCINSDAGKWHLRRVYISDADWDVCIDQVRRGFGADRTDSASSPRNATDKITHVVVQG